MLLRHFTGSNEFFQEIPLQKKHDYLQWEMKDRYTKEHSAVLKVSLQQPLKVYGKTIIRPEVSQNHRLAVTPLMLVLPLMVFWLSKSQKETVTWTFVTQAWDKIIPSDWNINKMLRTLRFSVSCNCKYLSVHLSPIFTAKSLYDNYPSNPYCC